MLKRSKFIAKHQSVEGNFCYTVLLLNLLPNQNRNIRVLKIHVCYISYILIFYLNNTLIIITNYIQ